MNRSPEEPEPGPEPDSEDGPFYAWLPPEDRLWRHPSESAGRRPPARDAGVLARAAAATRIYWAVAVVSGLIGAAAATGIGVASGLWPESTTVFRPSVQSTSAVSLAGAGPAEVNWTEIDDAIAPSVVSVSVNGATGPQLGSGVVVMSTQSACYIVTDRLLFTPGESAGYVGRISVGFLSGQTLTARLLGQDSLSGLAVIATAVPTEGAPAQLGTVSNLQEAAPVLALGSRAAPTVSPGTVSLEDMTVTLPDGSDQDDLLAVTMPALNPAARGGPLLDQYGELVGIVLGLQPVEAEQQQLTYAVPADEVARVVTEIVNRQAVTHPWFGMTDAADVPTAMAHQLGVSGGAQIRSVVSGGPAAKAGLHPDDIVVSLGGRPVTSAGALVSIVNSSSPGTRVPITFVHSGQTVESTVAVGEEPPDG